MKSVRLVSVLLSVCLVLSVGYASDKGSAKTEKDNYLMKLDHRYQKAIDLKEKGEYEAAIEMLQKLVDENQGDAKYEIARLDAIVEQSRDMKEAGNMAWRIKAKEAGYRIKTMLSANGGNGDYWVVYAKYSWIVETNKETHITKALQKAFYYKPDNPEAYIVQADYYFDKAVYARGDNGQNSMMQGVGTNTESDRFGLAKAAKSSYESALRGKLSNARKAYVYYKMGSLEERIFQENDSAGKYWARAVKLSPDSRAGKLAGNRLGN
ncbi:MAG TPA: hypothetical protein VMB78_06860 [Dissulfurispiraceae bacterium]|nr:hypothetical protein [Dissulfurispiraceae bacterium]